MWKCYITKVKTPPPYITKYNKTSTHPPPHQRYIICARPLTFGQKTNICSPPKKIGSPTKTSVDTHADSYMNLSSPPSTLGILKLSIPSRLSSSWMFQVPSHYPCSLPIPSLSSTHSSHVFLHLLCSYLSSSLQSPNFWRLGRLVPNPPNTYILYLLTGKVLTMQLPGYLSSLIRVNQLIRQLRPSSHRVLCSTAPRTVFASRAFSHAALVVWNKLTNLWNDIHSTLSVCLNLNKI